MKTLLSPCFRIRSLFGGGAEHAALLKVESELFFDSRTATLLQSI
jgi:hypothetical protein